MNIKGPSCPRAATNPIGGKWHELITAELQWVASLSVQELQSGIILLTFGNNHQVAILLTPQSPDNSLGEFPQILHFCQNATAPIFANRRFRVDLITDLITDSYSAGGELQFDVWQLSVALILREIASSLRACHPENCRKGRQSCHLVATVLNVATQIDATWCNKSSLRQP